MIKIPRATALLACVVVLAACQHAPTQPVDQAPAAVSSLRPSGVHAAGVAAASPLAVEAGVAILKAGGSAVDAAVAVQAALGLVEPQSSGLGGGAFLLHYDAVTGKVTAYDGRETAPTGASPDMFLDDDGNPLPYADAVTSGRSTGAPGVIAMLGLAHEHHGVLPWSSLFDTATEAADAGFIVP